MQPGSEVVDAASSTHIDIMEIIAVHPVSMIRHCILLARLFAFQTGNKAISLHITWDP